MANLCPNCGTEFKTGAFSSVTHLSKKDVLLINEYSSTPKETYCSKCGNNLLKDAKERVEKDIKELRKQIKESLHHIPIMTIQPPSNWAYDIVDIVSAQSVTGTGVISELSSDFNDLFGRRSNTLSNKLKGGEDFCKSQLKVQCLELGCHAIVGADIDYSEMGSLRGMMMVCMAGTAIKVHNTEVLIEKASIIDTLIIQQKRLSELEALN